MRLEHRRNEDDGHWYARGPHERSKHHRQAADQLYEDRQFRTQIGRGHTHGVEYAAERGGSSGRLRIPMRNEAVSNHEDATQEAPRAQRRVLMWWVYFYDCESSRKPFLGA